MHTKFRTQNPTRDAVRVSITKGGSMISGKDAESFYKCLVYSAWKHGNGNIEAGIKYMQETTKMPEHFAKRIRARYAMEGISPALSTEFGKSKVAILTEVRTMYAID